MKKIFSVMILAAALILICGQEKVFAYDVYCGTYRDGNKAYLMTETISGINEDFNCKVKAVKNGNVTVYINYHFHILPGPYVVFENSQGFNGFVSSVRGGSAPSPVAREIFINACNYRGWDKFGS